MLALTLNHTVTRYIVIVGKLKIKNSGSVSPTCFNSSLYIQFFPGNFLFLILLNRILTSSNLDPLRVLVIILQNNTKVSRGKRKRQSKHFFAREKMNYLQSHRCKNVALALARILLAMNESSGSAGLRSCFYTHNNRHHLLYNVSLIH